MKNIDVNNFDKTLFSFEDGDYVFDNINVTNGRITYEENEKPF